ncbi:universal stress protein [Streptomyces longispororuber]|uniref:Universal stress protein n=1 Tax=Streptomyces longispororuber TaxID=68230 RepID=A0A918Z6F5_9ACTN|nr:universal stress protein [Streptomyces longispororuber]GHE38922.1 universal stress protein [Streptomyces longispororuber]
MELPLVVGVDGSEHSLRAVAWAADEAVLRGVPLRLVHAASRDGEEEDEEGTALPGEPGRLAPKERADAVLDAAARRARRGRQGLRVSVRVRDEEPVPALLREARNATALVVASRGRSGIVELLLGSVSLGVAARADCPVIVLRGSHDNQARAGTRQRVVVGVGAEPECAAAVEFACAEAERRRVTLEAVRAWRRPVRYDASGPARSPGEPACPAQRRAADGLAAALRGAVADHPSVAVLQHPVEGSARRALLDASYRADLLVVGAPRRRAHLGFQLGRVGHALLHHSACPVAVVPQRA